MAISVTDWGIGYTTGSKTVSAPAGGVPGGALIVALCQEGGSNHVFTPTSGGSAGDTKSNSYPGPVGNTGVGTGNDGYVEWFYAADVTALTSADSFTYTCANSQNNTQVALFYATGIAVSSPLDTAATQTAIGQFSNISSVISGVPSQAGELFAAAAVNLGAGNVFQQDTTDGWATPPHFNNSNGGSNAYPTGGGTQINSGSGALTFAPTWTGGGNRGLTIIAFKPPAVPAFDMNSQAMMMLP